MSKLTLIYSQLLDFELSTTKFNFGYNLFRIPFKLKIYEFFSD